MKKKYILFGVLFMSVLFLGGCFKRVMDIKNTKSFYFHYDTGTYMNGYVNYRIDLKDDKYIARFKPDLVPSGEELIKEIDKEYVLKIEEIMTKYKVYTWDGFKKSDSRVLDGRSFSFSYYSTDGKTIEAHGYMVWPKNYGEFKKEIIDIFNEMFDYTNN